MTVKFNNEEIKKARGAWKYLCEKNKGNKECFDFEDFDKNIRRMKNGWFMHIWRNSSPHNY
jgi:hypothetical protein